MGRNTVRNITISINGKEVENTLNGVGKEIGKSKAALRGLTRGTKEYREESQRLRNLKKVYKEMNDEIRGQSSALSKLKGNIKSIGPAVLAAFSITSIASFGRMVYDQIQLFRELKKETKDLTGLEGTRLEDAISKTKALSDVYAQDYNEVLRTANALSKQYGVNYSEALELVQKGFEAGGDASGDLLNQLKEYGPQFKEANVSLEEMVALIAQTERQGIFNDKGADAIKESLIRLREGTKATREALNGIGIESDKLYANLESGSMDYFDAIKLVSTQLSGLKAQSPEVGAAIADIFGGPGEDAGLQFLTTIKDLDLELDNLVDTTDSLITERRRELEINARLNDSWQSLTTTGGLLNGVWLSLKESVAFWLESIDDATKSAETLDRVLGRDSLQESLSFLASPVTSGEYGRLKSLASSLRTMTENAEKAKDPILALQQELFRLNSVLGFEKGEGTEGQDRIKLIQAQQEEIKKLLEKYREEERKAKVKEDEEQQLRDEEQARRAAELARKKAELEEEQAKEAAERKRKRFEEEEDAIDLFLRKKAEDRYINSLQGLDKELALIDQKYNRELEKFAEHTERLAEIEAAKEAEKAEARLRFQQEYLERSNALDAENEALKEEIAFEKELAEAETQLQKDELRLERARELALRELEILKEAELAKVEAVEGSEELKAKIRENFALQASRINQQFNREEAELRKDQVKWTELTEEQKLGAITGALASAAEAFNEGSAAWKAVKISETLITTYQSAQNAFNALAAIPVVGPALGTAAAGLATLAGLRRVQQINNTPLQRVNPPRGARGYFEGGPTGSDAIGRDADGDIVGYVHANEYVIPEMMTRSPKYANTIGWLEQERQKNLRGYALGGPVSGSSESAASPGFNDSSPVLIDTLGRLASLLERPLAAQLKIGYEEDEQLQSLREDRVQSNNNGTLTQ